MSLTDGSLATLEGIQLQLAANLVGQNVQISGIDTTSINNITLQVGCLIPFFEACGAAVRAEGSLRRVHNSGRDPASQSVVPCQKA